MNQPPIRRGSTGAHPRSAGKHYAKQAPGMLLVTHDMGVVARLADDVAVMSHGKIVEQGDVETLFNAPNMR